MKRFPIRFAVEDFEDLMERLCTQKNRRGKQELTIPANKVALDTHCVLLSHIWLCCLSVRRIGG